MAEECKNRIWFKPSSTPITKLVIIYNYRTQVCTHVRIYRYPLLKSFLILFLTLRYSEAWPFLCIYSCATLNLYWRCFILHNVYLTSVIFSCHGWDLAEWIERLTANKYKRSQCRSRSCPGFDPSVLRHSGIWGAADEVVLNIVHKKIQQNHPFYI